MNRHVLLVPLLVALIGTARLSAAEGGHADHDGHDHGAAPAATAPGKKKPHVHGAHEEEGEEGDEHAHGEGGHGGHEEGGDEVSLAASVATTFGIISEPAQSRALAEMIMAPGWVVYDPAGQAQIATPAAGRVVAVHVNAGDVVKAGDPLVEILSPSYVEAQSAYILKRAAAAAADIHVESAKEILERGRKAGEGISGADFKRREAEVRQADVAKILADADLTAALSAVRLLGASPADLESLTKEGKIANTLILRAPVSGTVVDRTAIPGQQIPSDAPPLITIADTARLWVVVNIPEAEVSKVVVGSLAEMYAFNGVRLGDGDIASVTPDIDPHTRTGRARLAIAGSPTIRPGMYVQVRVTPLQADTGAKIVAVPESAVMTLEGRSVVFIAEPHGEEIHFRAQAVMTGPAMAGFVPILKGLEAGTLIVVQGTFLLKADLGKEGAEHEH